MWKHKKETIYFLKQSRQVCSKKSESFYLLLIIIIINLNIYTNFIKYALKISIKL